MTLIEELLQEEYEESRDYIGPEFKRGVQYGLRFAMNAIKNHSNWIPASKPPKRDVEVLVQSSWNSLYVGWYDSEEKRWYTDSFGFEKDEVVAWQPLPEPYRGE